MIDKNVSDIVAPLLWYVVNNKRPHHDILLEKFDRELNQDILRKSNDLALLTTFIIIAEYLPLFENASTTIRQNAIYLSHISRLRRAELVYKKLKAKTDKKSIIKEIKEGFNKAGHIDLTSAAKLYVGSVSSCLSQGFLPIPINALRYDNDSGFQELLIVSFSTKKTNEDKIEFQFAGHEAFKQPSSRALEAVNKLFTEEQRRILESLKLIVRLRDYPGGYIDQGHHGTTDSIGLAMAVAIYFNFQLYLARKNKNKLRQLRTVFEQELESIAFTGEIDDEGAITAISGIKQKVKAAENMEMKRVFCPVNNEAEAEKVRNEIKRDYEKNRVQDGTGNIKESLPVIPINSLEQVIALVRYGQYLKKATKATLPCFVESSFSILTDKHLKDHFLSNVTFSQVVKRQAEMFGGDITQGADRFAERDTFIPNQPKARVLEEFLAHGILLTGDGGMGKTTFLQHLLQDYSEKIISGSEIKEFKGQLKIPIYIELAKYKLSKELKDLVAIIKESLGKDLKYLSAEEVSDELKNGRFILLLDGVNEIAGNKMESFHNEMQSVPRENLFIVSSRGNTPINLPGVQRLEFEKFDKEKIERYIEDTLKSQPEKADVLKKVFTERHSDIGGNPFFLSLIVEDAEGKDAKEINEGRYRNRGKLLDRIVYKRFFLKSDKEEAIPDEKPLTLFKEIMPELARYLAFEKGQIFFRERDINDYAEKARKKAKVKQFLKILNNPNQSHIIRRFYGEPDDKNKSWKFTHDIFFEYFVAVALQTEFLRLMAETGMMPRPELADYLQEYINKKKWEDFVMITVGLLVDCDVEPSGKIGKFGEIYCECKEDGFFCRKQPDELPREQRSCPRAEDIKSFQLTSEMLPPRG